MKMTPVVVWLCCLILSLLAGCTNPASVPLVPLTPQLIDEDADLLIIDTDMAADDWLAILSLLMRPDLDIQAITVTRGKKRTAVPAPVTRWIWPPWRAGPIFR